MRKTMLRMICLLLVLVTALPLPAAHAAQLPTVTASAAIVMDYDTGEVLYAKDIDTLRVPASMTKIMTAYIIYEEMANGNLTKETMIPVSATAAAMSRNSNYPMPVPLTSGASYSVDTLLKLIMIPSASASCYTMAEYIGGSEAAFVKRMNETAAALGVDASFANCHGAQVHYITARGVATLIRAFIQEYPDILSYTSMTSVTFNGVTYSNTNNLLLSAYYYEGVDGFKTGTITAAGYCLSATAIRNGRRVITVVMHSTSNETRHTDSQKLLDYGFAEISIRDAARKTTQIEPSNAPASLRRNTDFDVSVSLTGVSADYKAAGGGWTLNGTVVDTFGAFTASEGLSFTLSGQAIPADYAADCVTVDFYITQIDGTKTELTFELPVRDEAAALYRDVDQHWAEVQIGALTARGLVSGNGSGYFRPEDSVTRAEFITVLAKYARDSGAYTAYTQEAPFADVLPGQWYYDNVAWAAEAGLVSGYGNGLFGPSDPISREQMAGILYNYFSKYEDTAEDETPVEEENMPADEAADMEETIAEDGVTDADEGSDVEQALAVDEMAPADTEEAEDEADIPDVEEPGETETELAGEMAEEAIVFTDLADISEWAYAAVTAIAQRGLFTGYADCAFRPTKMATRAEMVSVFYRCIA